MQIEPRQMPLRQRPQRAASYCGSVDQCGGSGCGTTVRLIARRVQPDGFDFQSSRVLARDKSTRAANHMIPSIMPARAIMQCQAAGERLPRCASQTGQTNTPCQQTPAVPDVSRIDVQFVAIVVPGLKRSGGRISCTRLLCCIRALSAAAIGFASLCPRLTGILSGEPVPVATAL